MKQNAAICYLTQNTAVRKTYLKTSLYFLFKHFNEKYQYPVIIFHEGDFDTHSQEEIIMGIRLSCRDLVTFHCLRPSDFILPAHIDKDRLERVLSIDPPPTPYWRDARYRMMCRWWLMCFMDYVKEYDYVMRLDDDSFIEEHITDDLFSWMNKKDLNYTSNFVHADCAICCYGMKDFFEKEFPNKKTIIDGIFTEVNLPSNRPYLQTLFTINNETPSDKAWEPTMYYNNFFITRTAFWRTPEMLEVLDKIDKNGSIFYYRWGDSPIQSILLMLMSKPEQIKKASFAYSKRLQRESYISDDNAFYSYMPINYTRTTCIIEDA